MDIGAALREEQLQALGKDLKLLLISSLTRRLNWFQDALQAALEPNGVPALTRAQAMVVSNIAAGETKAINIARNIGVSRQAVSLILSELSERDIITVSENPDDRRSRVAKLKTDLTDENEVCFRIFKALEKELENRIGTRRFKNLYEALDGEWGEPPILGTLPPTKQDADSHANSSSSAEMVSDRTDGTAP